MKKILIIAVAIIIASLTVATGFYFYKSNSETVSNTSAQVAKNKDIVTEEVSKIVSWDDQKKLTEELFSDNKTTKNKAIEIITKNPNHHPPSITIAMSIAMHEDGDKDDARFWYYVSTIRMHYDILRNTGDAEGSGLIMLGYAAPAAQVINADFLIEIESYKMAMEKAVAFVKDNEEQYDHRWLFVSEAWIGEEGMRDPEKALEQIPPAEPRSKWPKMKEEAIKSIESSFGQMVSSMEKNAKELDAPITEELIDKEMKLSAAVETSSLGINLCLNEDGFVNEPSDGGKVCRDSDKSSLWSDLSQYGATWGGCEFSINRSEKKYTYCFVYNDQTYQCTDENGCDFVDAASKRMQDSSPTRASNNSSDTSFNAPVLP